ncbi:hypothetical protein CHS0354_026284 [Potamilus streckersoni]|uniref:Uncharacterized protein n=1 Tax=Potamilus streckersoni TaxID=2493646 RepID=A0AAE0WD43_9BIVA|nr:hypothetical protein CHS0354_026284 [Potamilus streckersoni]
MPLMFGSKPLKISYNKENTCGIGPCHPTCLQHLVGVRSFIGVFGTLSLISWALYTVTVSQITNIERAFGLTSSESGWLLTVWEIGYLLCTFLASYFGPRIHIPRAMGFATVVCGLSGLVTALPHFVAFTNSIEISSNQHNLTTSSTYLCLNTTDISTGSLKLPSDVTKDPVPESYQKALAYGLFNLGMILQGAGKAPCYPYSSKYVDDSVDKQKTGYYMGNFTGTSNNSYLYRCFILKQFIPAQSPKTHNNVNYFANEMSCTLESNDGSGFHSPCFTGSTDI